MKKWCLYVIIDSSIQSSSLYERLLCALLIYSFCFMASDILQVKKRTDIVKDIFWIRAER